MKVLVTAGNTVVPIDRVRCLTNIFTGRTGAALALCAHGRGHDVTLLTSHPEAVQTLLDSAPAPPTEHWRIFRFRTFEELERLMAEHIEAGGTDAVIHCAAVSDHRSAGIFAPSKGTRFVPESGVWQGDAGSPRLEDRAAGKVKSDEPELWLRLVRTPKLVDRIRTDWRFRGVLVKFKLEVGVSDEQLRETAERSRVQSDADLMVANTLEGASTWAYLGPLPPGSPEGEPYKRVSRRELPERLLQTVEIKHRERTHG